MGGDLKEGGDGQALAPLFPLHTVMFPGGVLTLHLFEARYQLLVREGHDFVIVLIRSGSEVGRGGVEGVHPVGTMATATRVKPLPEGDFSVVVHGLHRVRILSVDRTGPYLRGLVERLPDPVTPSCPWLVAALGRRLAKHGVLLTPEVTAELVDPTGEGPIRAVWLAGAMHQGPPVRRQRLLESGNPDLAELLLDEAI